MSEAKRCRHPDCKQENPQPVENFYSSGVNTGDYLQSYCKWCSNAMHRKDYVPLKDRDRVLSPFCDTDEYRNLAMVETTAGMARMAMCRVAGELILTAGTKPRDRKEYEWSKSAIKLLDQVQNHVEWLVRAGMDRFEDDDAE